MKLNTNLTFLVNTIVHAEHGTVEITNIIIYIYQDEDENMKTRNDDTSIVIKIKNTFSQSLSSTLKFNAIFIDFLKSFEYKFILLIVSFVSHISWNENKIFCYLMLHPSLFC